MAQRATSFAMLITLLDVGERIRPLVLMDPERAARAAMPPVLELFGQELRALSPAEFDNLDHFVGLLLDGIRAARSS